MGDDAVLRRALRAGADEVTGPAERAARRLEKRALREGLLDVAYARIDSPLGALLGAVTPRGLVMLSYLEGDEGAALERLAARVSPRVLRAPARLDAVRRELEEYFLGRRRGFGLPVDWALVRGAFARRVLEALAAVPYGRVTTYTGIAASAGSPRGARAAGNALGANPIPIVVPCHRVLHQGGGLGGYGGGLERKRLLLDLEAGGGGLSRP